MKKAARKPLCVRPKAAAYWAGLAPLLVSELDEEDWDGVALLCFFECFLVPVVPEAPEVFTPEVSVALGLGLLPIDAGLDEELLRLASEAPEAPDVPDAPDLVPEAPALFTPEVSVALGVGLLPIDAGLDEELLPLMPEVPEAPEDVPGAAAPEVPVAPEEREVFTPEVSVALGEESLPIEVGLDAELPEDLSAEPVGPAAPVCASAIEDTDATSTNDNVRSVSFRVISHSFSLKEKHRYSSLDAAIARSFSLSLRE